MPVEFLTAKPAPDAKGAPSLAVESPTPGPDVAPDVPFGPLEFRRALGRFATGVTVVTMLPHDENGAARRAPAPHGVYGFTVNAFMSLSLDPPLVGVSIDKAAKAHATLVASRRFGVSVLGVEQRPLSDAFSGRPVPVVDDPFEDLAGFPVVAGALTQMVCEAYDALDAGDHTIFVGRVTALTSRPGEPLVFYEAGYAQLVP